MDLDDFIAALEAVRDDVGGQVTVYVSAARTASDPASWNGISQDTPIQGFAGAAVVIATS